MKNIKIALVPVVLLCVVSSWNLPTAISQSIFDSIITQQRWRLFFSSGSAAMSADAASTLDSFMQVYQSVAPGHLVRLYAYTDSDGSEAFNQKLAARRMMTIREHLLRSGIPAQNIRPNVFGESNPLGDNSTEEGKQLNRRVELHLQKEVPMRTLSGVLKDQITGNPIPGTVVFRSGNLVDSVRTSSTGKYEASVPSILPVQVEAYAKGYFFNATKLPALKPEQGVVQQKSTELDMTMQPATIGASIDIPDLFFKPGLAELLPESLPTLELLERFFLSNPKLVVEIGGHIHLPGINPATLKPGNRNFDLSVGRAKVVYEYLKKKKVPVSQMSYRGYGNQWMRYPNAGDYSPEAVKNRRVELKVLAH